MSSDKRNDDFVVRLPEGKFDQAEKDPFLARTSSHKHVHAPAGLKDSFSRIENSPGISILAYCLASISMTVVNKYCVSGPDWNLNLFYLAVQVCFVLVANAQSAF